MEQKQLYMHHRIWQHKWNIFNIKIQINHINKQYSIHKCNITSQIWKFVGLKKSLSFAKVVIYEDIQLCEVSLYKHTHIYIIHMIHDDT